jgi:hypothetical protein
MQTNIVNCKEFRDQLAQAFPEYVFNLGRAGAGWIRVFILYQGVTLGRFSLRQVKGGHEVYTLKHYKPRGMSYKSEDRFFYLYGVWETTGKVPSIDFCALIEKAKDLKDKDLAKKQKWRDMNPAPWKAYIGEDGKKHWKTNSRPKLNRNWMSTFYGLIYEELQIHV